MARIHGCHVTSRDAMLFMKYEYYGKCIGSFKDSQRKCKLYLQYVNTLFWSLLSQNERNMAFGMLVAENSVNELQVCFVAFVVLFITS